MVTGGCFCGKVRYQANAPGSLPTICHCSDCRRAIGAQSVAWFTVPREALCFVAGAPARFVSSPGAVRSFCAACGTSLTFEGSAHPDETDVTTASLDDPESMPPADHTRAGSKLGWEQLCDGLPVYAVSRPGRG